MNRLLTYTFLFGKRVLKMPIVIILLFSIPIASLVISLTAKDSGKATVSFGIYIEDDGNYSSAIKESLLHGDNAFFFCEYSDMEDLKKDVMLGKLEAGYVFDRDFSKKIESGDFDDCLKTYYSPATVMSSAGNEIIFSKIMQLCGYTIIGKYVDESPLDDVTKIKASKDLSRIYEEYCHSGQVFHLDIETVSGVQINNEGLDDLGVTFPLRGVLAILIFLCSFTGSIAWCKDREQGIFAPRSHSFCILSRILYPMIPAVLFLICSHIALMACGLAGSFISEMLIGARYLIITTVFCFLCSTLIKKSSLLISLIPVITLGSLIFCPIFINIETLIPALGFISKLFIPRYYM